MFDSLVVEHNGRTLDVQTKRFDCLLYNYRVGDWICGAPPGVVAYFDILRLDADGQRVYGPQATSVPAYTLLVVLAHGVFVDSEIRDGEMDPEAISQALMQRREAWQDSARLLGFLVEQLRLKQQRLRNYDRVLGAAQMAIKHVQDSRAGRRSERERRFFGSLHPEIKRLDDGEDPLTVIASILAPPESDRPFLNDPPQDPLADYRL